MLYSERSLKIFLRRVFYRLYSILNNDRNADFNKNGERWVVQHLIKQHDTVFDVGASTGEWADLLPSMILYQGFEPRPGRQKAVEDIAISDFNGKATFYDSGEGSALTPRTVDTYETSYEVRVKTLDTHLADTLRDHIDFLKIDTEGNEMAVLRGAQGLLAKGAIKYIQFEYGGCWIDSRQYLRDAFELLGRYGYDIYKIHPRGLEKVTYKEKLESFQYANYLAWKK
jgi:FkbM family methyltransferase